LTNQEIAWPLGVEPDLLIDTIRQCEPHNWLPHLVFPKMSYVTLPQNGLERFPFSPVHIPRPQNISAVLDQKLIQPSALTCHSSSTERAAAFLRMALNFKNAISMGLKSG